MEESITVEYAGRPLTISSGLVAKQADGSVLVRYGDTVVLVTVVGDRRETEKDFLPLTVNYQEMTYAAGKFPGGFFKRESRPSDKETLTSRLIDRPLRPLFSKGWRNETQVIATVLSADQENDPGLLGMIGASAAMVISPIPFAGPMAGIKIGRVNGEFIMNPSLQQMDESDLDIILAGTRDAILMVEGEARFIKGEELIEAIDLAHRSLIPLLDMQEQLRAKVGKEKWPAKPAGAPQELKAEIRTVAEKDLTEAFSIPNKRERGDRLQAIYNELAAKYADAGPLAVSRSFEEIKKEMMRESLFATGKRIDGRSADDIRKITCQVGILPRTHGTSLFTRGETQALAVTTFGTAEDEQKIESLLEGVSYKSFMLHYNFPPYSVGEVSFLRAKSRREIGHGNLAERALAPILPSKEEFPYTIRIVSEILESNGSSSMASVCSGCLSLMDAGVPIKEPVAGIAMGLLIQDGKDIVLSDILGDEDAMGDMDFKIAGTREGVTAVQMDIKTKGINKEIMRKAVHQAQAGIGRILDIMAEALPSPRQDLSPYAPRIYTITIKPEKIREVIGPGGKVIKSIVEQTGVKIDIEDSGIVRIVSQDAQAANAAIEMVKKITKEAEVGGLYMGKVKKVVDFGAIVEILPGIDGLVHVSQLSDTYIKKVSDVVKEGDEILVKVLDVEPNGRIRLSRKAAVKETREKKRMYRKTVLDNGIRVVTETLPYFPTVSFGIWWKTGSRYEDPTNNGISHFIEHMLFKGTANRTAYDIAREIDAIGGTLNAFTGKEYTCVYARVLKRDMDIAIDILADMYKNSLFSEEDIEREKQVINQEIKMIDDNPEEYLFDMFGAAYYKGHPLGMPILGKEENVREMTRERLLAHFFRHHAPANTIVTATGRIDHDAFVKKIDKLFVESSSSGQAAPPVEKPSACIGIDVYEKDLEHIYLCIGTDGVGQTDRGRYPLYALNAIVGGSMSSHLFQEIREKRGLVYSIFSYVNCFHDAGNFGISTSTSLEYLEEVIGLIKEEMAQLRNEGVAASEIRFSKEHIKGNFFISLESSEARMGRVAKNEIYFDGYVPLKETLKSIDGIQKAHVDEMSQSVFGDLSRMSLAILGRVDKNDVERLWKS